MEYLQKLIKCCRNEETKEEEKLEGRNMINLAGQREKRSDLSSNVSLIEKTIQTNNNRSQKLTSMGGIKPVNPEPPSFQNIMQGHSRPVVPEEIRPLEIKDSRPSVELKISRESNKALPEDIRQNNNVGSFGNPNQNEFPEIQTPIFQQKSESFCQVAAPMDENHSERFSMVGQRGKSKKNKKGSVGFDRSEPFLSFKDKKLRYLNQKKMRTVSPEEKLRFAAYASGTKVNSKSRRLANARLSEKEKIKCTISYYDKEDHYKNPKARKLRAIRDDLIFKTKCCKGLIQLKTRSMTPQPFRMSNRPLY